jgi:hypothetical protein
VTDEPLLTMTLKGPEIKPGRVPADYLVRILNRVQVCVKRLGQELLGEKSTTGSGRFKGPIEAACRLEIVALTGGSFAIGVDVPVSIPAEESPLLPDEHLGQQAVQSLVDGIGSLSADNPVLPHEFGYGVLVALKDVGNILDRGVSVIEFELRNGSKPPQRATFNLTTRDRVLQHIKEPVVSQARVRGSLREVNLERRTCQLFPSHGKPVGCNFEDHLQPMIRTALGCYVAAVGVARRSSETGRIVELALEQVSVLDAPQTGAPILSRPATAQALLQSLRDAGVVGMWKDRDDIGDSSEFAEELRRRPREPDEE